MFYLMVIFFFQIDSDSVCENALFEKLNAGVSKGEVTKAAASFQLGWRTSCIERE